MTDTSTTPPLQPKRFSRAKIIRLLLTAVGFAVLLVVAEIVARNWLLANRPSRYFIFAAHTPAAYAKSSYYSMDFLAEQSQTVRSMFVDADGNFTSNYQGRWYNFDNLLRRTVGQPDHADHTVYVFGNSTMLSMEVPDEYTIPSHLQAMFNALSTDYAGHVGQYRVVNLGHSASFANRELTVLKTLPIQPGDIIVFYDGINDAMLGGGGPSEPESLPVQLCGWLSSKMPNLSLAKIYCLFTPTRGPTTDTQWWQKNAQAMGERYETSIRQAAAYVATKHATFYHFLQATILSRPTSTYEQALIDNPQLVAGDIRFIYASVLNVWPTLQASQKRLRQQGVQSTDLTHVLDATRASGIELYIDFYHVNEIGNQMVAQAIFDALTLF